MYLKRSVSESFQGKMSLFAEFPHVITSTYIKYVCQHYIQSTFTLLNKSERYLGHSNIKQTKESRETIFSQKIQKRCLRLDQGLMLRKKKRKNLLPWSNKIKTNRTSHHLHHTPTK